ncbi:MAG: SDR family NAD(P)-dependent oxidoreductase [Acidimicrobiales bacterium]|nr:SDR family NAD(P)-dependent oxidoreductase [Acidimicrobiales bacterium]
MSTHRFDRSVVIVTGAGRGIGRAYAVLLAALGAAVVVNDRGGSMAGEGSDAGPAAEVVAEISADGGKAIADANDVSDPDGAEALVATALARFGRVDALINNAGIMRWAGLPELDAGDLDSHFAVHALGSFNTAKATWPHMVEQGAGRIVMTTSAGMLGLPNNTAYAGAKGAVVGLTRSLSTAGAPHGIAVNAIAPAAFTRMAGRGEPPPEMAPALVAPMVAYLAHESCPVTGEIYAAGAGRFSRIFVGSTPGYVHPGATPTVDDVARNWSAINNEDGYSVPTDLMDWSDTFMAHLDDSE